MAFKKNTNLRNHVKPMNQERNLKGSAYHVAMVKITMAKLLELQHENR